MRLAEDGDLSALIGLYESVGFSNAADIDRRGALWVELLESEATHVAVAIVDSTIVASATLITAPNLLRGGRRHGFLENVATRPDRQGKGHGRAVVRYLLGLAWQADCYHVLLQSGRSDPRVHRFYEKLGFVAGLRTACVAHRPA